MEMTQYQKDLVRVWDGLRTDYKGSHNCCPILCKQCPLNEVCSSDGFTHTIFNADKAIEIVTQWVKEHPLVTYEQKYEEVFGIKPKCRDVYVCPRFVGFLNYECPNHACEKCKEEFWNSEYKEPKKEDEES